MIKTPHLTSSSKFVNLTSATKIVPTAETRTDIYPSYTSYKPLSQKGIVQSLGLLLRTNRRILIVTAPRNFFSFWQSWQAHHVKFLIHSHLQSRKLSSTIASPPIVPDIIAKYFFKSDSQTRQSMFTIIPRIGQSNRINKRAPSTAHLFLLNTT